MTSHDPEDSGAPPPAPKKSGRSQSPRAMERRRLQNRIAQRNHRRRLKEQIAAEEAGEIQDVQPASTFQQTPSDPLPDSPSPTLSQPMDATLVSDDLFNQATSPWPGLDPMLIQMPAIDPALNNPGQWAFPSPNGCTCNSITGPCARHLQYIRSQALDQKMDAKFKDPPKKKQKTKSEDGSPRTQAGSLNSNPKSTHHRSSSYQRPGYLSRALASSERLSITTDSTSRSSSSDVRSGSSNLPKSIGPTSTSDASSSSSYESSSHDAIAQNTARLKGILEAVRAAGFADFEKMAAAYYTMQFEKSSLPDLAQKSSRGRRLKQLLYYLHENSSSWPRWESKGLRESVMENARTVCIDEMDRVTTRHEEPRAVEGEMNSSMDMDGISDGSSVGPGVVLENLPSLPESVEMTVQDEAPYLWTLITELAGPQGLYCDRVAQAVLAVLAESRQSH